MLGPSWRSGYGRAIPPKTPRDAEWGAEPLGLRIQKPIRGCRKCIEWPRRILPRPANLKRQTISPQKKPNPTAKTAPTDLPAFLKATKSDRSVNLSEDNGQDITKSRGLHDVSLEPIMAVANPPDMAMESLRQALAQDQLQIYLEPILSLPHRRLAFSRVSSYIEFDDKQILSPINYRDLAHEAGLMGAIDNMTLTRVVQRIRRLRRGRQTLPLFCPISSDTLHERELFNDFRVFLRSNAELASHIIFSFRQYDLERIDTRTEGDLIELNRFGFRYSVEDVINTDIFAVDYSRRGIKFIELSAQNLLKNFPSVGQSNAVKKLLDPGGLDLIATGIEDEENLLDMLDYNIDYGSGAVFGVPRPSNDAD